MGRGNVTQCKYWDKKYCANEQTNLLQVNSAERHCCILVESQGSLGPTPKGFFAIHTAKNRPDVSIVVLSQSSEPRNTDSLNPNLWALPENHKVGDKVPVKLVQTLTTSAFVLWRCLSFPDYDYLLVRILQLNIHKSQGLRNSRPGDVKTNRNPTCIFPLSVSAKVWLLLWRLLCAIFFLHFFSWMDFCPLFFYVLHIRLNIVRLHIFHMESPVYTRFASLSFLS